ncbi:MAG: chloramphenicol phosphotransferase [Actinomycetota bacterium]|nr:chloramphenicol phosphotransferase [Actinomycetota bacterium]
MSPTVPGRIVVLNGPPRSGKSTIAASMQDRFEGVWMNLGVDVFVRGATPERYRPGIGLRPGGERPEIEALVPVLYAAMYECVAVHSRLGLNVVVDVGHHDAYARPLGILPQVASQLDGLPALLVGVRCPIEVIMQRRDASQPGREGRYATSAPDGAVPEVVRRWQREAHRPGIYDLEVDTSALSPPECADLIGRRLVGGPPPTAFRRIARSSRT